MEIRNFVWKIIFKLIPVPFAHAFGMRWINIFGNNLFPSTSTKPAPKKALHLFDFLYLFTILIQAD